jgi:hypothetical protein
VDLLERSGARVDRESDADFSGEVAAVLVGIGDDDVAGTGVAGDGGGHDADGAGSGDEDIFAEDGKGQGGVDGVAEGIEDSGDLAGDAGSMLPDVGHGEDDVLGEGTVAVDSDTEGVGAEMAAAGEAVAATSADDVAFSADELANSDVGDIGADFNDLADELVADDEAGGNGGAGPRVPVVDVEIGTADTGGENANFDVVDADLRLRDLFEPEAALGPAFYECLHRDTFPVSWPGKVICP